MKLRSSLLLAVTTAGLFLGTLTPTHAATTDPVTDLTVSVAQTPGRHDSWTVSASWTANPDATAYSVLIADNADGSVTPGKAYGNKDAAGSPASIVSDNLVAGQTYWVAVQPINPAVGTVTTAAFTPAALDTTAPNGAFKVSRTTAFLSGGDPFGGSAGTATVLITQTALDAGTVTRTVVPGDGSAVKSWTTSSPFPLQYTRAGTFAPKVRLADGFGNVRELTLPAVSVRADTIAPTVRITRPANPGKVASWRVVRGTASDVGNGLQAIGSFVIEKRGAIWWSYDFSKRKWLKGFATIRTTIRRSHAAAAFMRPTASGTWRTPAIRGLTRGVLHIEAIAIDKSFNGRLVKVDQRVR